MGDDSSALDRETQQTERLRLKLEAQIIEQEHRPFRVLSTFFLERPNWSADDPRRLAACKALLWWLVSGSRTIVIVSGGVFVGLMGVLLALQANRLLLGQNRLIHVQATLGESARRASLVYELSSILDQIDRELHRPGRRDSNARGQASRLRLTGQTYGRIVALSRSLRPYRYLQPVQRNVPASSEQHHLKPTSAGFVQLFREFLLGGVDAGDVDTLTGLRSPERAQLLIALLSSGIDMDPIYNRKANFSYADLEDADLANAYLKGANLRHAYLDGANLQDANLAGALLEDAHFGRWTELNNANLEGTYLFGADLSEAIIHQEELNSACTDEQTRLPDGRKHPENPPAGCRYIRKPQG